MDFADISGGAVADDTGYGAVGYDYRMGVHEVSRTMIESYNSLSGGPAITLQDMTSYGGNGVNRPATGVSWNEAARFVNWLNTNSGSVAAYKFIGNIPFVLCPSALDPAGGGRVESGFATRCGRDDAMVRGKAGR